MLIKLICRAGTVESRIRQLVMKLEYVDSLTLAHPFVKGFEQVSYCLSDEEVRAVAQGEISDAIAKRKKEDIEGKEGASPVHSTTFYIGLAIEPKPRAHFDSCHLLCSVLFGLESDSLFVLVLEAGATGPRRLDISYPTTEFTKLVKVWETFDEATMGIVVRHIKRSASYLLIRQAYWLIQKFYCASSALPDYVFDEGERQPRLAQKRVKVCTCTPH